MHTDTLTTDTLLEDILNPHLSAPAICRAHNITLAQLIEFIQGPDFQQLTEATRLLSESRTELLALDIAPRAMQALDQSTETDEESRLLNETIRKSATKLLTIARQSTASAHRLPREPAEEITATNSGGLPHSQSNETIHPCQSNAGRSPITSPACRRSAEGGAGEVSAPADGGGLRSSQPLPHTPSPSHASSPRLPGEVTSRTGDGGGLESNLPPPSLPFATPAHAIAAAAGSTQPAHLSTSRTPP